MRLAIQSIDGQQRQMDVMAKITQGRQVLRLHSDDIWKLLIEAESESRLNRHRYHDMADVMIWKMPQWDLGNRQVDNMMDKVRSDLHIGGFQVTMDDALLMGGLYTFSNLTANFQGFLNRQWAFGNTLLEGLAWDQLQHQKMHVIRVLKAIDSCDVGVIQ